MPLRVAECRWRGGAVQAAEKYALLTALGAIVEKVPPLSYSNPEQYCNLARERAAQDPSGCFADQFDNPANWQAHYATTAPEIWEQTGGHLDAVVLAAGTGGTLAGVSRYLKERAPAVRVLLIDPPGSALYGRVVHGVLYANEEREGRRKRVRVRTARQYVWTARAR